jgi:hypothetical protein
MPVFHAFVTIDTDNFLAIPDRVQKLLSMCEKTLNDSECDENTKAHAAKMLEVFILQCNTRVSPMIPSILNLMFSQLRKPIDEATSLNHYRPQLYMVCSKFTQQLQYIIEKPLTITIHTQG